MRERKTRGSADSSQRHRPSSLARRRAVTIGLPDAFLVRTSRRRSSGSSAQGGIMSPVVRSIANVVVLLGMAGCDDFLGIGADLDVDVIAEVKQDENLIGFTVENRSD